jgi:hypothetical protein
VLPRSTTGRLKSSMHLGCAPCRVMAMRQSKIRCSTTYVWQLPKRKQNDKGINFRLGEGASLVSNSCGLRHDGNA